MTADRIPPPHVSPDLWVYRAGCPCERCRDYVSGRATAPAYPEPEPRLPPLNDSTYLPWCNCPSCEDHRAEDDDDDDDDDDDGFYHAGGWADDEADPDAGMTLSLVTIHDNGAVCRSEAWRPNSASWFDLLEDFLNALPLAGYSIDPSKVDQVLEAARGDL